MINNRDSSIHIVYIGPQSFPIGAATTKRRRYMIDYMNKHNISSHYLVTTLDGGRKMNASEGVYGLCSYCDISQFASKNNIIGYIRKGKEKLREWFDPKVNNILVFHTLVNWNEWIFYKYAQKLGYYIVFDQVETSYLQNDTGSILFRAQVRVSEYLSSKAYKECPAFVISTALYQENREKFPKRKLCLLPNSTPIIKSETKVSFNTPLLLLYSGTYSPKDGVADLIDGVIMAYKRGVNCKLLLLGKGTSSDMRVLDKIIGKDYFEYLGYVNDDVLNNTMKDCDILCMTRTNSKFANYGFPFKLSEYLSTGNILLATNVGDVRQYVEDKKSAFIVDPENPKSIAEAIEYIDQHREEALLIARNGHKVMEEKFSIDRVGEIFVDFLNSIVHA